MQSDLILKARSYFLSFDEQEMNKFLLSVDEKTRQIILKIEDVFHSNGDLKDAAQELGLVDQLTDLKELQIEYYIGLSDLQEAGGKSNAFRRIYESKSKLFHQIQDMFSSSSNFNTILYKAIKLQVLRKDFNEKYNRIKLELENRRDYRDVAAYRIRHLKPWSLTAILIILVFLLIAALILYFTFFS